MLKDEKIIEVVDKITTKYPNINGVHLRNIIEEILYNCDIISIENALVLRNNTLDKIKIYLASRRIDGLSNRTLKGYYQHLIRFSNSIHKNIEDITTMDIRYYLAQYLKTNIKNTTLATEISTLKAFFKWLQIEKYIIDNPMDRIKNVQIDKYVREYLTHEELEIVRDSCNTLRQRALVEFIYSSGARLEEIIKLNKTDIDWQELSVKVVGKGNKERIVLISPKAKIHIQKYLMSRLDDNPALFITERHPINRLSGRAVEKEFSKIGENAKLSKPLFPHILRHSVASHLLQSGASLSEVQRYLGHSSPTTTQIYSRITDDMVKIAHKKYIN
jgi:integrase/recombinase XerD